MYTSHHTVTGFIIYEVCQKYLPQDLAIPISIGGALVSHIILDKVNEYNFKSIENKFCYQLVLNIITILLVMDNLTGWYLVIFIATNLPDIWDSKFYLSFIFPDKVTHSRSWFCHKKGYTIFNLNSLGDITMFFGLSLILVYL